MALPLPWGDSSSDESYEPEVKDEKDHMHLERDVYCNLALGLIKWHDKWADESAEDEDAHMCPSMPVVHALIIWFFNLLFQCLIVCIVLLAAERAEEPLEEFTFMARYNHTRSEVIQVLGGAVATGKPALPSWFDETLMKVCAEQMVPAFAWTSAWMTLLWIMVMVGEIKVCMWWCIFIVNSPHPSTQLLSQRELADVKHGQQNEGPIHLLAVPHPSKPNDVVIRALTPLLKAVLLLIVPIVRLMIAVFLMLAGIKFVFVQTNMANAVLKVMTLKFVMTVDEVLIKAMATKYGDRILKDATIYSPGSRTRCCGSTRLARRWDNLGGMFWLTMALVMWVVLFWAIFGGEFNFRVACLRYHEAFPGSFGVREAYTVAGSLDLLLN